MGKGRPPQDVGVQVRALLWLEVTSSTFLATVGALDQEFSRPAPRLSDDPRPFAQVHRFGTDPHERPGSYSLVTELDFQDEFPSSIYRSDVWRLLIPPEPRDGELQDIIFRQCQIYRVRRDVLLPRFIESTSPVAFALEARPSAEFHIAVGKLGTLEFDGLALLAALFRDATNKGAFRHAVVMKDVLIDTAKDFLRKNVDDEFTQQLFMALLHKRLFRKMGTDLIRTEWYREAWEWVEEMYRPKKRAKKGKARIKKQVIPSLAANSVALLLFEEASPNVFGPNHHDLTARLRGQDGGKSYEQVLALIMKRFHLT